MVWHGVPLSIGYEGAGCDELHLMRHGVPGMCGESWFAIKEVGLQAKDRLRGLA